MWQRGGSGKAISISKMKKKKACDGIVAGDDACNA